MINQERFNKIARYISPNTQSEEIDFLQLICYLSDLEEKIESLENRLDKEDEYRMEQNE